MTSVSVRGGARRVGRVLAVAFVLVNALAVVYANRLAPWTEHWTAYAQTHWDRADVRAVDWALWVFGWYPFLSGLDQRYTMFSTVARDEFTWRFFAVDGDGTRREVPGASDHKSGKFYLNIYGDDGARLRYATYLCRRAASDGAAAVDHLDWEWWYHTFRPRRAAQQLGTHWQSAPWLWRTERFACPH